MNHEATDGEEAKKSPTFDPKTLAEELKDKSYVLRSTLTDSLPYKKNIIIQQVSDFLDHLANEILNAEEESKRTQGAATDDSSTHE